MTPIPGKIAEFLQRHHVLSLAVQDAQGLWAASCFYACDLAAGQLIVLTSLKTRHGQQMTQMPVVAGTISGQPEHWRDICGLQFTARAQLLDGAEADAALECFAVRHPIARLKRTDIWALRLEQLKYTSNDYLFAQKTHWQRDGQVEAE